MVAHDKLLIFAAAIRKESFYIFCSFGVSMVIFCYSGFIAVAVFRPQSQ